MSVNEFIDNLDEAQKQNVTEIGLTDSQKSSLTASELSKILEELPSLTTLDLSGCSNIEKVDIQLSESLQSLNLSGCDNLSEVNLDGCLSLTEVTGLSSNSTVQQISINGCDSLRTLDVSNCSGLRTLDCSSNNLDELVVDDCEELVTLDCSYNSLSELSIRGCLNLTRLYCYSNNLQTLELPVQKLEWLVCDNNRLQTLDLEENRQLQRLDCQNNGMGALEIDRGVFSKLQMLKCYGQKIRDMIVNRSGSAFQVNMLYYLSGYAASLRGSSSENTSGVTGAFSAGNIVNVKGYDNAGNPIELTSYDPSTGTATFASSPAKVSYGYQTNFNNIVMDVTVGEDVKEEQSSETQDDVSKKGGCNAGIGTAGLVIMMGMLLKKKDL
ncbi:MAG: hypothetical protein IJP97_01275 [Synergistaceae bacterium]|nr:hypothetical protein [Synergistaceae bacterium]